MRVFKSEETPKNNPAPNISLCNKNQRQIRKVI